MIRYFIIIVILLIPSLVNAVPFTTMGFMKVPDAYILPKNMFELSFSGYTYNENGKYHEQLPDKWNFASAYTLNYGYNNFVEIGFVYNILEKIDHEKENNKPPDEEAFRNDNIQKDIFYINLKLRLFKETKEFPAISLGIENLFSERNIDDIYIERFNSNEDEYYNHDMDDYRENSFYLAFSKKALLKKVFYSKSIELYWTLGIGVGRFIGPSFSKDLFRGFFGSLSIKLHNNLIFAVENDGYCLNTGVQYDIGNFSLKSGIYRFDELFTWNQHPRISFSVQYTFDTLSPKSANEKRTKFFEIDKKKTEKIIPDKAKDLNEKFNLKNDYKFKVELEKIRQKRQKIEKEIVKIQQLLNEVE